MKTRIYATPAVKGLSSNTENINPSSADHDYSRFQFVLLADQITVNYW